MITRQEERKVVARHLLAFVMIGAACSSDSDEGTASDTTRATARPMTARPTTARPTTARDDTATTTATDDVELTQASILDEILDRGELA